MGTKTIGIIGCGAIGETLAAYIEKELKPYVSGIVFFDVVRVCAEKLAKNTANSKIFSNIDDVVASSDLIIESAVGSCVPDLLRKVIDSEKDIMIMSIGGLLTVKDLLVEAEKKGVKVILPSGAIAGLDAIKASKVAGIKKVTLTTRKAPGSISGAPYLIENDIDVEKITEETVIFEGNVTEAVKGFPKNINVSALLSLAGIGPDKTKVKIIVSPEYTRNIHEIEVESEAGKITTRAENVPFPKNPKTSYLAALAAITALEGYFKNVRIGT
ncbi:MAG: aspartate dehydrogenase [Candidatus Omnitrophica bacterium]|nr:aspartate dehydrogenase [Candidatus Omnitrophota bacterium]